MQNFRAIFEEYGADYAQTMPRFMGNESLYLKLLSMLFEDTNLQKLGAALGAGDMAGAFEAGHTLKGVVGNMGLTPFYEAVCAMVEPLRNGEQREDYPQLYQAIRTEYKRAEELQKKLTGGETV